MMRRLKCLLRRHQWQTEFNYATQGTERECARCGAHVSTYPGSTNHGQRPSGTWGSAAGSHDGGGFDGGGGDGQ